MMMKDDDDDDDGDDGDDDDDDDDDGDDDVEAEAKAGAEAEANDFPVSSGILSCWVRLQDRPHFYHWQILQSEEC